MNNNMDYEKVKGCKKPEPGSTGHNLMPTDPDSPMSWSLGKKIYTSSVAWLFAFVVLYGTTTYAIAIPTVEKAYHTTSHLANLGFTLPFCGVFFAPIFTPHVSERWGRRPVYFTSISLFSLCVVVIGLAPNTATLLAFRFLAGLFGGPVVVLIEGTFADIWPAQRTVTYYAFLAPSQYLGAAFGPIIGAYVLENKGPAWLSWVTLLFATFAIAYGGWMPETYSREILRTRIHYKRSGIVLPCAESGVTLAEMARVTVFTPLKMLFTEPVVIVMALYLGLQFALVFQWFISVPTVLTLVYGFDVKQDGLAFIGAVGGTILAAITSALMESITTRIAKGAMQPIEARLWPAIAGSLLTTGCLFWIGFTAKPTVSYFAPIFGTAVFVWGNAMILISFISYLFDAYPPAGTLSALTTCACFRLASAGIVPIFIITMIQKLGGAWTYSTFGIIAAVMILIPLGLFKFGAKLRAKSPYSAGGMTVMEAEWMAMHGSETDTSSNA